MNLENISFPTTGLQFCVKQCSTGRVPTVLLITPRLVSWETKRQQWFYIPKTICGCLSNRIMSLGLALKIREGRKQSLPRPLILLYYWTAQKFLLLSFSWLHFENFYARLAIPTSHLCEHQHTITASIALVRRPSSASHSQNIILFWLWKAFFEEKTQILWILAYYALMSYFLQQ